MALSALDNRSTSHRRQVFILVGAGVFLSTMDSSMVNIALPTLMAQFDASFSHIRWVVLCYLLAITVSLLFFGMAADRFGAGAIYLVGVGGFVCGSLACALVFRLDLLLACRIVQGLGAAMLMAAGPALIRELFAPHHLGRGLGLVGIATSLGLMSGPLVGGILLTYFSWRTIFLVNLPLGLVMLVAGFVLLKGAKPPVTRPRSLDLKGALLWAAIIISMVVFLDLAPTFGVISGTFGAVWLGTLIACFYLAEKSGTVNLIPRHLFCAGYYPIGLITAAVSFGVLFMVLLIMPFYLSLIKGLAPDRMGFVMMAVPVSVGVVGPVAGILHDRFGARIPATGGLLLCGGACMLLAGLSPGHPPLAIGWRLALLGMGQALFLVPNSASLLSGISTEDVGITAGLLATARNLGMLVGAAVGAVLLGALFQQLSGGVHLHDFTALQTPPFMTALKISFWVAAAASFGNAALSWRR
jgi:EmrB/QacA subfamily drug resistance transporter